MNNEQTASLIRSLIQMVCAGWIAKGVITEGNVDTLTSAVQIILPGIIAIGTTIYGSIVKRSDRNLVRAARKVQEKSDESIRTVR